ncbi:MAG: hypothetical protein L6R38_008568 [Xanthoria sp. 2 TBL-2021]|nr:MAG: hypothetical protein L6R38_008568 [Xanthoria sp. 2 TBL-2021]
METIHGLNINGPAIIATAVVFTFLTVAAVGLRFFAKRIAGSTYRWDDWLLLLALIIFVTTEVLVIISDVVGRKATSDTDARYWIYRRLVYVYSIFYFVVIGLVELSILLLYRHIFYPTHLRHTSIVLAVVCIAWLIAALVIEIGYPGHTIEAYFPGSSGVVFNVKYLPFWLAVALIETLIEITILVLPLREIYRLQISKQKKYLISCSLLLGSFVIITGIVRMAVLYRPGKIDIDLTQGDIWLNVHLGTAIISACLPTFRPLMSRRSDSRQAYSSRKGSYTVNHSTVLSASRNRARGAIGSDSREGIIMNPQSDLRGTFADARRTTSSDASSTKWQDDGPVKSGEAIGVKKTIEVV